MKHILWMTVASCALMAIAQSTPAQASDLCPGLRGQARTDCLVAERDRGRRETARIEQRNRNLDTARDVVCVGTRSSIPGKIGGAIGDRLLRQDRPCTPRAR